MIMRTPSLIKIGIIIVTVWVIFIYQQYLHTSTAPYVDVKPQFPVPFDPIRHGTICRDNNNNVTTPTSSSTNNDFVDLNGKNDETERSCRREFHRVTDQRPDHVPGLTPDDYERSIAHVGNRYRIAAFVQKLIQSTTTTTTEVNSSSSSSSSSRHYRNHHKYSPVTIVVCGGSISMGHGVEPQSARYSDALEVWMNEVYPTSRSNVAFDPAVQSTYEYNYADQYPHRHRVYFRGGHGANICSMAKRLNYLTLPRPRKPDLFILEFAVNNYQAEDQHTFLHHRDNVYFEGFEQFVECTEIVIGRLLTDYPDVAIVFLDMHSAVPNRKTAQSLHVGVAQHYQIPVLSYADVMMPDYFRLIAALKPYDYSIPSDMVPQMEMDFPFPHGCSECRLNDLTEQFRPDGCWSLCAILQEADIFKGNCDQGSKRRPCYVPMFDHDEVHPSKTGHKIVRDLIIHLLARVAYDLCQGRTFPPHQLPIHGGWLVTSSTGSADQSYMKDLLALSDYATVQDIKYNFAVTIPLLPKNNTNGFANVDDNLGRKGWVATASSGGESITFALTVPKAECYVVSLTILKSYKTVGKFTVDIFDVTKNKRTKSMDIDCLWGAKISVPVDLELTKDGSTDCTGKCMITVTTHAEVQGRGGNLIKITSLSARRCI